MGISESRKQRWRKRSEIFAHVFFLLLGAGFFVGGIVGGYGKAHAAFARSDYSGFLLIGFMGGLFTLLGALMILAVFVKPKKLRVEKRLRKTNPDAPWMWKQEWAEKKIESFGRGNPAVWWIGAALFGLIGAKLTTDFSRHFHEHGNAAYALGVLAPLTLWLVWGGIRSTVHRRRFGVSVLELTSLPGRVGGTLDCVLHASWQLAGATSLKTRIDCIEDRKHDDQGERIEWQSDRRVDRSEFRIEPDGASIPIRFEIPRDARPSRKPGAQGGILWRLHVRAQLEGVDFHCEFEVPIYRVESATPPIQTPRECAPDAALASVPTKIRVRPWGNSGNEFIFGAARQPKESLFVSAAALIFSAVTLYAELPGFVRGLGVLTSLTAWAVALSLWFGVTRVRVTPGRLEVMRSLFGIGPQKSFDAWKVQGIEVRPGVQMLDRLFYNLVLVTETPRRRRPGSTARHTTTVGVRIPSEALAESLASKMRVSMGIEG